MAFQDKHVFSSRECAEYIGFSESFLRKARMNGPRDKHVVAPPFLKIGRKVIYLKEDCDAWLGHFKAEAASVAAPKKLGAR